MPSKRKNESLFTNLSLNPERKHIRFGADDGHFSDRVNSTYETAETTSSLGDSHSIALLAKSHAVLHASAEAYVLDLAFSTAGNTLLAASDSAIHVYEVSQSSLLEKQHYSDLKGPVTAVCFVPGSSTCMYACGGGGEVICWDVRQKEASQRYTTGGQYLNCLDSSDSLLAVGTNGSVLFWDRRKASSSNEATTESLAEFGDTHEAEVTQVRFNPEEETFLSGSTDGLISVFDISSQLDEDDGFKGALNLMDSVAEMSFYGHGAKQLWCRTHTENFYTWEWHAACDEDAEGGEGPSASLKDAREQANKAASSSAGAEQFEYIAGCSYSSESNRLSLACGTADGSCASFPLNTDEDQFNLQTPSLLLRGGHNGVGNPDTDTVQV